MAGTDQKGRAAQDEAQAVSGSNMQMHVFVAHKLFSSFIYLHVFRTPFLNIPRQLPEITHRVYLNIEIEGEPHHSGQVVLGLFGGIAPRAVQNFVSLCNCDKGNGQLSDKPLCYKGTEFHRISECFLVVHLRRGHHGRESID